MSLKEVEAAALKLDIKERAELASVLLESLDEDEETLSKEEIEGLWADEAQRRADEWDGGKIVGLPGEQVLREARERLKRR